MAEIKSLRPAQLKKLQEAVREGLKERGIAGKVELEPSGWAGRYRLYVISPDFGHLIEAERQDILWRILHERWSRADQVRITLTAALTPEEAGVS